MVQATMAVYKDAMDSFLPTPSKSHYIFNLRDFARVIRGVLLAPHTHMQVGVKTKITCLIRLFWIALSLPHVLYVGFICQDGDKLIRLWIHEVYRVFYDRLIDSEDKETFFSIVKERTSDFFKKSVEKVHICLVHTYTLNECVKKNSFAHWWLTNNQFLRQTTINTKFVQTLHP